MKIMRFHILTSDVPSQRQFFSAHCCLLEASKLGQRSVLVAVSHREWCNSPEGKFPAWAERSGVETMSRGSLSVHYHSVLCLCEARAWGESQEWAWRICPSPHVPTKTAPKGQTQWTVSVPGNPTKTTPFLFLIKVNPRGISADP